MPKFSNPLTLQFLYQICEKNCDSFWYHLLFTKLTFFLQRYHWMKMSFPGWTEEHPFPKDIIYRFEDALEYLCPKIKVAINFDEAVSAVETLNTKMLADISLTNPVS